MPLYPYLYTVKRLTSTLLATLLCTVSALAANLRMAVVPVEFSDVHFTNLQTGVYNKVSDAKDYLDNQFSPRYNFVFDVLPPVRLPYRMSHYGANSTSERDVELPDAVRTACRLTGADFSPYDNDGDGRIDNICIITAGHSEADGGGADCIWPRQGHLYEHVGNVMLNGKTADCFIVCPEFSGAGTFCHEIGHVFGFSDLYDTDGKLSGGQSRGLWGTLSIMDSGGNMPNFCSIELEHLNMGFCIPGEVGHYKLQPLSRGREFIRIGTDNENEYFLLECRDNSGYDATTGGAGLLIYHIDKSNSDAWYSNLYGRNLTALERWKFNQVNCRPEHQCARVVEAVPGTDNIAEVFFPQPGHSAFGSQTDPSFRFWDGTISEVAVCNITRCDDGSIELDILVPIVLGEAQVFQDAAILRWTLDGNIRLRECSVYWTDGVTSGTMKAAPEDDGSCSVTIEGLSPQTDYQATIRAICTDGSTFTRPTSFRTRVLPQGARPYIYLNVPERSADGSFPKGCKFPLRVYNASGVQAVSWYFNGQRTSPGSDELWTVEESGTLRAEIWYTNGSREIIAKQITVK